MCLEFSFHTSREDFSFFSLETRMLKWNSSFLTVSYFCQALWNNGFTAGTVYPVYILHMLRHEHQTIRRVTKALIQRNLSKTPPLQMQYIVIYMITDIGATEKKCQWMVFFWQDFHGNNQMKLENIQFAFCSYLPLGTRLNARQSHFTTKLACVHACLDLKLVKQRILISWEMSVSFC